MPVVTVAINYLDIMLQVLGCEYTYMFYDRLTCTNNFALRDAPISSPSIDDLKDLPHEWPEGRQHSQRPGVHS